MNYNRQRLHVIKIKYRRVSQASKEGAMSKNRIFPEFVRREMFKLPLQLKELIFFISFIKLLQQTNSRNLHLLFNTTLFYWHLLITFTLFVAIRTLEPANLCILVVCEDLAVGKNILAAFGLTRWLTRNICDASKELKAVQFSGIWNKISQQHIN